MGCCFSKSTELSDGIPTNNEQTKAMSVEKNLTKEKLISARDNAQEPKPHLLRKKDLIKHEDDFSKIDQHARKAPEKLRTSLPNLVNYLSIPSKDPLYLVRSFFVWIAHNIRYDTEGYFGTTEKSKCDFQSVMLTGRSVCEGYANVMEEMCKQAGIPAKKISGFSKGFSYSPDSWFTTSSSTNHAWNAVYIRGHWFLLDGTWGAGSLNRETKQFKAEFNEFYFLTDPAHFVYSHFPYQAGNIKESEKWQLLKQPYSLEKFNSSIKIQPAAFEIGILPASHKDCVVSFSNEVKLAFIEAEPKGNVFSTTLYRKEENILYEEAFCCYTYWTGGLLKINVKPPKSGTYRLTLFGRKRTNEKNETMPELFEYTLNCTVHSNTNKLRKCPYPKAFTQAYVDECEVIEPLGKQILPNINVNMQFRSTYLSRMMINQQMLKKQGETFKGTVTSPESGYLITIYGSRSESGSLAGQYEFCVA